MAEKKPPVEELVLSDDVVKEKFAEPTSEDTFASRLAFSKFEAFDRIRVLMYFGTPPVQLSAAKELVRWSKAGKDYNPSEVDIHVGEIEIKEEE